MAEYVNVERPFLEKLAQLGWRVIDQGCGVVPHDPAVSLRSNFREVILADEFRDSLRRINLTENGRSWLTDKQLDDLVRSLTNWPGAGLLEVGAQQNLLDVERGVQLA